MAGGIEDRRQDDRRLEPGDSDREQRTGRERRARVDRRVGWDRRAAVERRTLGGIPGAASRRAALDRREEDRRIGGRNSLMMDLYLNNQLEVLGFFERQSFAPGQVVVSTGEVHRSLYLVESGLFDVLVPSAAGSLSAALLRRGDVFGELAFFDGEPRSAEIRAAEASVALVLTRSALDRFRAKEPELAFEFAMRVGAVVSRRFRVHNRRLASLSMIGSRAVW